MQIIGAGLAGLLAGVMLRRHKPVILEAQTSLPNNHDALLRFRTDAVSRVTGIPFKKVLVQKGICYKYEIITKPNLKLSNLYSQKVTGEVESRSISNLDPVDRFIAPPDLIRQMAHGLDIQYNTHLNEVKDCGQPTISTIPMPILMRITEWKTDHKFNYKTITTLTCDVLEPKMEVYQTLYYPGPEKFYRASITGRHLIIEFIGRQDIGDESTVIHRVLDDMGINRSQVENKRVKVQEYGKIAPVPPEVRKTFILAMSDKHNIYSLGRYGTWRQLLLDDVVKDIDTIEQLITQRDSYAKRLALS